MGTTRAILTPESAHFPSSNFGSLTAVNGRPTIAFDATTDETVYWTLVAPQGLVNTLSAVISYVMASATSGTCGWKVAVEAVTDGDATDLDTTTSFDTANSGSATVPATAGYLDQQTITLTNADLIAAADYVRISVQRDAAGDSATGDAYLLAVEIREA